MEFCEEAQVWKYGAVCTLSKTHYLVEGSLGASNKSMVTARFDFGSGAGFNIIRRTALPPNGQSQVDVKDAPSRLCDENGRPLEIGKSVWLTAKFANMLYPVKYIIATRLEGGFPFWSYCAPCSTSKKENLPPDRQ